MGFSEAAPEGNSSHQKVQKISEGKIEFNLKMKENSGQGKRIQFANQREHKQETGFEASRFSHNIIMFKGLLENLKLR